jgi:hypothetical protein
MDYHVQNYIKLCNYILLAIVTVTHTPYLNKKRKPGSDDWLAVESTKIWQAGRV